MLDLYKDKLKDPDLLSMVTDAQDASVRLISVIDTGKGIPTEYHHLLFRKFQQVTANILTRDSTRSMGLGLYMARLMAQGMGGDVQLKSSHVDKGSVFTIELPQAR